MYQQSINIVLVVCSIIIMYLVLLDLLDAISLEVFHRLYLVHHHMIMV